MTLFVVIASRTNWQRMSMCLALVLDGIIGEVDAAAVVDLDVDPPNHTFRLRHEHDVALDELVEPNRFLAGLEKSRVLRLYGRERHRLLQLRSPADGRPVKDEQDARRRPPRLKVTCPVGIAESLKDA